MNDKFALHFRIFTRADLADPATSTKLLALFAENEHFRPDAFGGSEPARTEFGDDLSSPAKLLSETSMNLVLKRKRPRFLAYLNWHRARRRPWFWTLDLGEEWLREGRHEAAASFVADLSLCASAVFAAGALSSDWFDKHDVRDERTGDLRERLGASFEVGMGLPGIYWFNYFGRELIDHFGTRLKELKETILQTDSATAFLAYPAPDARDRAWRRSREAAIVARLGPEFFFDLDNAAKGRRRRRSPIAKVTDATSLRG